MAEELAGIERAKSPAEVLAALSDDLGRDGYQRDLDDVHVASFVKRGRKLLVVFETLQNALQVSPTGLPLSLDFVEDKGWSLLHIASRKDSWFRAPSVYDYFDELVDQGFFDEFDQVAFYGAGMGAYGACAFSVTAPGANVLAIAPQATLDSERAGWDMRFPNAKRLVFNDRYGYAPEMVEGANKVFILFDPYRPLDHVHASLFHGLNVTRLRCRHLDGKIERALLELDVLHAVIEAAANGTILESDFFTMLRKRRSSARYQRTLFQACMRRNRPLLAAYLCKVVLEKHNGGSFFKKNLTAVKKLISQRGPLPDWLAEEPGADLVKANQPP